MTELSALLGARIRRIDAPHDELLSIVLSGPTVRTTVLVFCFGQHARGVGLVATRPHGNAASSFVQKLRKELTGARLCAFEQPRPATLALLLQRGPTQCRLMCDFDPAQITLTDEAEKALATQAPRVARAAKHTHIVWPASVEELTELGERLLHDNADSAIAQRRTEIGKLIRTAQKRLDRRLHALRDDIQRADQAEPLRARASLVLMNLHSIRRGSTEVQLLDYTKDPPQQVPIVLDPSQETRTQVEAWFKQARRFERGAQLALQRQASTQQEIEKLKQLRDQLAAADDTALETIAQSARAMGVRGIGSQTGGTNRPKRPQRHKPYRELRGHGQRPILVGKGAEDNDTLIRDHARPHDLWLHARDASGAHVIVPLERGETCPQELLLDAAHLAAHFSDARNQPIVDVSYTSKRYVRKRRHTPAGQVQLDQEKVLTLHPNPTRLAQLLTTEIQD
jgi:predicted ribosome quality control (RQC) complex YloA/Tae2 family protein